MLMLGNDPRTLLLRALLLDWFGQLLLLAGIMFGPAWLGLSSFRQLQFESQGLWLIC